MNNLLTKDELYSITEKLRPHCQHKWFQNTFGVDLPKNSSMVVITWSTFEALQARRVGLLSTGLMDKPKIYSKRL